MPLLQGASSSCRWRSISFAVQNFFGSEHSWRSSFFCHATFTRRNTFLEAAANFLLDSQFLRVLSFLF
jgi:hypothetical protein